MDCRFVGHETLRFTISLYQREGRKSREGRGGLQIILSPIIEQNKRFRGVILRGPTNINPVTIPAA